MKRILFILLLFSQCYCAWAESHSITVRADDRTLSDGYLFPEICISYKNQYFSCFTLVEYCTKDSLKLFSHFSPVDLSNCDPKKNTLGGNGVHEKRAIDKHGCAKCTTIMPVLCFPRIVEEGKEIHVKTSYDINTRKMSKSSVTYEIYEDAWKP